MPLTLHVHDNCRTTLSAGINDSTLTIPLTDGSKFPAVPCVCSCSKSDRSAMEKMLVDSRSGNTITVNAAGRGYSGTSAVAHDSGDLFFLSAMEEVIAEIQAAVDLNTAKVTNATHSGDVTGSGELTIAAGAVDLAMMANLAQDKIIGRATASTGVPEAIDCTAAGRALLDDANAAAQLTTLGALPLAGGTMTGDITLAENAGIALDPAGSADEKWTGITVAGTAGATLAVGDLCYLDVSAAEWLLADADAAATSGPVVLGLCILAGEDGQATRMLLMGTMRSAAFPASIALGAPVYVSETAGDITATQPSGTDDVIRVCGWAVSAEPNTIYFSPSADFITHT